MKPKRDQRVLIADIRSSIAAILSRTRGIDLAAFEADETIWKATLYDLQVMGEAAKRLPDEMSASNPEIPWREMIAMRDFLAHGYYRVELKRLWALIERELGEVDAKLAALDD